MTGIANMLAFDRLPELKDGASTKRTARGRAFVGFSEFTVAIRPDNAGVRLRRLGDQQQGRQRARMLVDGTPVAEREWYAAESNPHRRWREDDFDIPAAYTRGKARITVRLEHLPMDDAPPWTEFRYEIYSQRIAPRGA